MSSKKTHDKYSNYRYCIVKECKNTSIKTPGKLWIRLPSETMIRNAWLKLAKRDPLTLSKHSQLFFCEDHFDLEYDMENYLQYKLMGSVKRIKIKPGCVPSKFECQSLVKRKSTPKLRKPRNKPQHASRKRAASKDDITKVITLAVKRALKDNKEHSTLDSSTASAHEESSDEDAVVPSSSSAQHEFLDEADEVLQHNSRFCDQATQSQPEIRHVSCQVVEHAQCVTKCHRSTQVQLSTTVKGAVSSLCRVEPENKYASGDSLTLSQIGSSINTSPLKVSSQPIVDSLQDKIIKYQKLNLLSTVSKIKRNPSLYIGIPADVYFIVDVISKHTKLSEKHVLLCLMKIRLNRSFSELADDFDVSLAQAIYIFYSNISLIVSVLSPFTKTFTTGTIKKNLPTVFCHKYHQVNCIMDCLEIEIQKPTKAIHQDLTWSEYKRTYTCKYLLAYTPDGLVRFVSAGYGGSISNVNLLEHSRFLDSLEPCSCILVDRDFRHIEMYLKQRGFMLLRLPSNCKSFTEDEVRQAKEITSFRSHVERVIQRIREFSILKPHSEGDFSLLGVLDNCVTTACSLINLQESP